VPEWDVSFDLRVDVQDPEIVSAAATVEALASVIRGIPIPPAVVNKIDGLNILRAVRGTTGIEGTELTEQEVAEIMSAPPHQPVLPAARQRAEQEARNAKRVMQFVASKVHEEPACPVTEDLIRTIHDLTTQDIDYPSNRPGHYRDHAVSAGTYIPPRTGEDVRRLMGQFVEWFNEGPAKSWPAAVRAVVAHFYVISIHPFGDGNGRTARGIESFILYQGGINARGFYSLANYYYQNRPEYVASLDHVRFTSGGDLTPFVKFALTGLVSELEEVHREILAEVKVIAFRDFAREELTLHGKMGTKPGERMFHFLLGLAEGPVSLTTLRRGGHPLSEFYRHVTTKTLARDLNFLRAHQLVRVNGDEVRANVEVMEEFMPAIALPEIRRKRRAPKR
jgi:Fic family protein